MSPEASTSGGDQSVEELRRELAEARQQQAASAGILAVISNSPTDPYRVFAEIAASAAGLCDAHDATITQLTGDRLRFLAHHGSLPTTGPVGGWSTLPRTPGSVTARAVIDKQIIHVADLAAETEEFPEGSELARRFGHRSILVVPLMRAGEPIGIITLRRAEVRPFTNQQIQLVKTFADQAVIAIENARLFEAEQARTRELTERTRELTEALEYQTATSEVLNIISRLPNELQPVLDAIAAKARELCRAQTGAVFSFDGELIHVAAADVNLNREAAEALRHTYPDSPRRGGTTSRAILNRGVVYIPDVREDPEYDHRALATAMGYLSTLAVPMLQGDRPIGAITLTAAEVAAFSPRQIELLTTFADQAVIAIENTRLFEAEQASKRELQESLEYQTATSEVLQAISRSAFELQPVIDTLVETAARLCDADAWLYRREGEGYRWAASYGFSREQHERIKAYNRQRTLVPHRGNTSMRAALEGRSVHIVDVLADPEYDNPEFQELGGFRTTLAVPLLRDGMTIGVLTLTRTEVRPFTDKQIELLTTFADQAVIAIENARLFDEVQARTRELAKTVEDLEIASQHKNQFVANMSHELRTPLAAILGYAELIQEGFYGAMPEKSLDALTRIRSNGKHLLGLINTVLDIAKIESGQFTLNMTEYAIGSVVETVRAATESLAQNKKLVLKTEVAKSLPIGLGDEQRLTQVLLNLVGNAIKFTDAGEVSIAAGARNGHFVVSVTDTGPGIPLDQQARIFEQFHQVDSSLTKAKGGTGLGLTIAKQIVEMHGGRIWVESTLGKGSTFQMELPTRAQVARSA